MLRAAIRQDIYNMLEKTYFGIDNFIVYYSEEQKQHVVFEVRFLGDSKFYFLLKKDTDEKEISFKKTYPLVAEETPGVNYVSTETFHCEDISDALNRLDQWTKRLYEDIIASNPLAKEVSILRQQLEEHLAGLGQEANNFFTKDEAAELEERLNAFSARLDELAAENDSLKDNLADLKQTVSDLQGAVGLLNRGTWLRMAAGRVLSGLKKMAGSKGVQELALEAARRLLPPGPQ